MPSLTRDQQRAQHALRCVKNVSGEFRSEYQSCANSLPANILMNGIGQACAMLLAQAGRQKTNGRARDSAHQQLYSHLQDWLCVGEQSVYAGQSNLVEAIISHGQSQYIQAQVEALAYLDWLKKFAQAYLAGENK